MSTPPQPSFIACAVSRTESVSAQQPVPGIMRPASTPAPTRRSSRSTFSSVESELASELVPNTARPTSWLSSQRHCLTKRSGSGERSALKGVTTGERTPVIRSLVLTRWAPWVREGPQRCLCYHQLKTARRLWESSVQTPTRGFRSSFAAVLGEVRHHRLEREITVREVEGEQAAGVQHVEIETEGFAGQQVHGDGVRAEGVHDDKVVALSGALVPHLAHADAGVAHLDAHRRASAHRVGD